MPMRYWLMKSDPGSFGWDDLKASPGRRTVWDGVRNYQARNFLRDDVERGNASSFTTPARRRRWWEPAR